MTKVNVGGMAEAAFYLGTRCSFDDEGNVNTDNLETAIGEIGNLPGEGTRIKLRELLRLNGEHVADAINKVANMPAGEAATVFGAFLTGVLTTIASRAESVEEEPKPSPKSFYVVPTEDYHSLN